MMQPNFFTTTLLPIVLAIIMFGLGLSLTIADFKRIMRFPKAAIVGLFCQMLVLPAFCFALCLMLNLNNELSVGMMLLVATPGGATANLYSHLAKGDLALNITLTAINSILTIITLPAVVYFSMWYFMDANEQIPLQLKKIIEVFSLVLIPLAIGMFFKQLLPAFAEKSEKPVKIMSAVFLILVVFGAFNHESGNAMNYVIAIGAATIILNVVSMWTGYLVPLLFKIDRKQAIAISFEAGIHNGIVAMYTATNVLGNSTMAIPAAVYGIVSLIAAAIHTRVLLRLHKQAEG
jgi:BASS family bile acid:Na+ symporter